MPVEVPPAAPAPPPPADAPLFGLGPLPPGLPYLVKVPPIG